jgi:hypothetical protein
MLTPKKRTTDLAARRGPGSKLLIFLKPVWLVVKFTDDVRSCLIPGAKDIFPSERRARAPSRVDPVKPDTRRVGNRDALGPRPMLRSAIGAEPTDPLRAHTRQAAAIAPVAPIPYA